MTVTERKRRRTPHQPVGRWIRPNKRLAIYARDGWRCLLCGRALLIHRFRWITLDHVVPRSRGGTNDARNLYTACRDCNSRRQSRPLRAVASAEAIARIRNARRRRLRIPREAA